jgi:hypothetical protein
MMYFANLQNFVFCSPFSVSPNNLSNTLKKMTNCLTCIVNILQLITFSCDGVRSERRVLNEQPFGQFHSIRSACNIFPKDRKASNAFDAALSGSTTPNRNGISMRVGPGTSSGICRLRSFGQSAFCNTHTIC